MALQESGAKPNVDAPSPGWYDDPSSPDQLRYWDGSQWTATAVSKTASPPTGAAQTVAQTGGANGTRPPARSEATPKRPWWKRPWVIVVGGLFLIGMIGSALSPSEQSKTTTVVKKAVAPAPAKVVKLTMLAPRDGGTVRAHSVLIRGVVSPSSAEVLVGGEPANVHGSRFVARVPLDIGDNSIDVAASQEGFDPASQSLTITRERTAREMAALRERRRQRRIAAERRAAERRAAAARREQARIAAMTKTFSGSGSKNIGTLHVDEASVLEWSNNADPTFRQMLIYDDDFGISVTSGAASGDTVVPAGTYRNITVAGGDSWTLRIHPR